MQARYLLYFRVLLAATLGFYAAHFQGPSATHALLAAVLAFYALTALLAWRLGRESSFSEPLQLASFFIDVAVTTLILYFTTGFQSEFYVAYFLVILSTCFLEKIQFSFLVGFVACFVYAYFAYPGAHGFDALYTLRTSLLLVTAFFSAYVADRARTIERAAVEREAEHLAWMQRLATAGRAMAAVLHEAKTPLSTIMLSAEQAQELAKGHRVLSPFLEAIYREAEKTLSILGDFLDFSRPQDLDMAPVDLGSALKKALGTIRPHAANRDVLVEVAELPAVRIIMGSERHLAQAFVNVMINAVEAMPKGGRLDIRLRRDGTRARLRFSDNGDGIASADLRRLSEPFFTTKGNEGTGLGLTIARWIVEKHSGWIEIGSEGPGRGATVDIVLPLTASY